MNSNTEVQSQKAKPKSGDANRSLLNTFRIREGINNINGSAAKNNQLKVFSICCDVNIACSAPLFFINGRRYPENIVPSVDESTNPVIVAAITTTAVIMCTNLKSLGSTILLKSTTYNVGAANSNKTIL